MRIGIIMNGVTGRMGLNQHLVRSIVAIREQGGVRLAGGERLLPDPILVGRSEENLREIAGAHGIERVSTDLDACLADPGDAVYFDATLTSLRADHVRRAIAAGKHVYCEKPLAPPRRRQWTSLGGRSAAPSSTAWSRTSCSSRGSAN